MRVVPLVVSVMRETVGSCVGLTVTLSRLRPRAENRLATRLSAPMWFSMRTASTQRCDGAASPGTGASPAAWRRKTCWGVRMSGMVCGA